MSELSALVDVLADELFEQFASRHPGKGDRSAGGDQGKLDLLIVQVASMQAKLDRILGQREIRSHYSVTEFASEVNRSTETVESWCRNGRIVGQRKKHGRGANKEWVIERSELERYRMEGLLPMASRNGTGVQR